MVGNQYIYKDKALIWFFICPSTFRYSTECCNGGNFEAIFLSFSRSHFEIWQNELRIELVFRAACFCCVIAKKSKKYKRISKMRKRKKKILSTSVLDWCYHRNKYIHHCDSQTKLISKETIAIKVKYEFNAMKIHCDSIGFAFSITSMKPKNTCEQFHWAQSAFSASSKLASSFTVVVSHLVHAHRINFVFIC